MEGDVYRSVSLLAKVLKGVGGRSSEPRHSNEAFFEEESAERFRVIFNHFELLTSIELEGLKRHLVYTKTLTSNGHNS